MLNDKWLGNMHAFQDVAKQDIGLEQQVSHTPEKTTWSTYRDGGIGRLRDQHLQIL